MRELHTFTDERHASLLANVLQSRSMPAEVTQEENSWVVWVLSDDHRDNAREVLVEFQQNPDAPEFATATQMLKQQQADARAAENKRPESCRFEFRIAGPESGGSAIPQP